MLVRPQLDPSISYQKDITFKVMYFDGKGWTKEYTINGMGVMPEAQYYKIKVYAAGKADMLTITSCHREVKTANPDKSWFSSGYTFDFKPVLGIETQRTCPIDIGVYEKKAGRHGWGTLVIASNREKLHAFTRCNGKEKQYHGTSVCQAKAGLVQEYIFKVPVDIATIAGCEIKKSNDGKAWRFLMPSGECVVYFIDKADPDRFHQANFFGYDTIPIRGVN